MKKSDKRRDLMNLRSMSFRSVEKCNSSKSEMNIPLKLLWKSNPYFKIFALFKTRNLLSFNF